jgi:hypothetical protein
MVRLPFTAALLFFFAGSLSFLAPTNGPTVTWSGYVTDTYCGFNRVNKPPTASCTKECVKNKDAKYAFFNFADKKVYVLNPQAEAAKYAGQAVVVKGTLGGLEKFATGKGQSSGAILTASSITPEASK